MSKSSTGNENSLANNDLDKAKFVANISTHRLAGHINESIRLCEEAKVLFPSDYFFSKILADLYLEAKDYQNAFIALADFLGQMPPSRKLVDQFARRYFRFRRVLNQSEMSRFSELLANTIKEAEVNDYIIKNVNTIISRDISILDNQVYDEDEKKFRTLIEDDSKFDELVKLEKVIETKSTDKLLAILDDALISFTPSQKSFRNFLYFVSIYERFSKYDSALEIVVKLLRIKLDPVAVRSLFRICRNLKNYDEVDDLLAREASLVKTHDFNILYELVYYFEAKNDFEHLQRILTNIEKSFAQNTPVLRTLRNFYIRFGMLEDAKRLEPAILQLYKNKDGTSRKYVENLAESETELASKVQDLYSQLEHQKQLAAISDLTTGISHELGQPITNIRYTIQFYKKLFQKSASPSLAGVTKVFESILEETERMGGLIKRLAPLTSSKSVNERFDILERIKKRVSSENPRLRESRISVKVSPNIPIFIAGDPVKFDQLISNLLLNAIDAVNECKVKKAKSIQIQVLDQDKEVKVTFADTGVGVPIKNRNKIFDPFFSTKAPGKGEGLGLFIVWNLLKILGGRISIDATYNNGAKFIIYVPKRIESQESKK